MRNAYLQMCDFGSRFRILKGGKISLVVSAFIASTTLLHAAPSGGVVTAGTASIAQSGSVTNITQTTQKAAINWQNFSIGATETVNFNQPNVSAITLNRVVGNEKSIIDGALNANGQVFILNSNGLLFSKNASINTAGLVATTMNLSDADFNAGNYAFKGDSTASIINQGTINISDKGYAALFGKEVRNEGIIKATLGAVHVSGASEVTLNLNGNSLVNLKVDKGVLDALVENKGAIYADGGEVYLTTNAVNELLKGVVNNTGIVEAQTLDDIAGKVILFAHGGEAQVGGSIKAEGGFVETSGDHVKINDTAIIKSDKWLIDPLDFTIAASGGDITGAALGTLLASNSITIQTATSPTATATNLIGSAGTNGDIIVNDAVSWGSDFDLTLNAYRNIAINKNITATGTGGKLSLYYGQGSAGGGATDDYTLASGVKIGLKDGQNFSTRKGSTGTLKNYTVISTLGTATDLNNGVGLQGMTKNGLYALSVDIDISATSGWNSGAGWKPVGANGTGNEFTGSFDGLGHTIDGLYINRPTEYYVGFFGKIDSSSSVVQNVHLTNVDIKGNYVGALIGGIANIGMVQNASSSTATDKFVTGATTANGVGGLIGVVSGANSKIANVHSSANVQGNNIVGGLIGSSAALSISDSYATGSVTAIGTRTDNGYIGGLVGYSSAGTISNSYATGNVSTVGWGYTGGLVGYMTGAISTSYATGSVAGGYHTGGLVGHSSGAISYSHATGNVSGSTYMHIGGLAGKVSNSAISNSYSTGSVSGSTNVGGFIGVAESGTAISNSYSTGDVTANGTNVGGFIGQLTGTGALVTASITKSYSLGNVTQTYITDSSRADTTGGFIGGLMMNLDSARDYSITKSYSTGNVTNGFGFIGTYVPVTNAVTNKLTLTDNYWSSNVANAYSTTGGAFTTPFSNNTVDISASSKYAATTYANFDFANDWYIIEGKMKPILRSEYSTTISNAHQLQLVGMDTTTLAATYTQSKNIDFVSTTEMAKTWNPLNYFVGIGDDSNRFKGNYDGNGKTISNINIINNSGDTGLFGSVAQSAGDTINIKNVGLLGGTITHTGGSNSNEAVGALVGYMRGDTISNSYSTATVISDGKYNGGLVGILYNGILSYSYSAGAVQVSGSGFATGGLVGFVNASASANNNYSRSSVATTGGSYAGGFAGFTTGAITNSYSAGAVSGSGTLGGFIGSGSTPSGNNFWDTEASGQANSGGEEAGSITGKTTAEMKTSSTFSGAGWDTSAVWGRKDTLNNGYMVLKGMYANDPSITFSTPVTITLGGNLTKTYGDATNPTLSYTSSDGAITLGWGSAMTQWTDAGTYAFSAANILAPTYASGTADDWAITYSYGSYGITVNPYTLALTGFTAGNKVYNASTTASVTGTLGAALNGDTATLTGTFADKNVGTGKTVTAGVSNANYTIAATTDTADITAKALTAITGITASNKVYNGLTSATIDFASAGFIGKEGGDTLSISAATGAFDTKHVDTGKTVTISSITLGGTDAGNYSITGLTPTTTADITAKAVTLTAPDVTREYNGNDTYTASAGDLSTLSALLGVAGDSISAITLAFNSKDIGTNNKTLTPSAATISDGNSGNNYAITYADNTTSTISPKALSLSGAVADNKVYDGLATATMSNYGTITGVIGTEVVTIDTSSATSAFADKNVGTGKTVTISGVTLGGADAGNYTAGSSLTTTANITRLSSVTWVGGATGDWSLASNWAGGAIPDFSNVANVVIPTGKTVAFDAGLTAPVHVDNISSLGGLDVAAGTLNVANLLSTATYNQTGGAVTGHDMTVTTSYAQPAGTITMSGDVTINQAVGGIAIGELASDTLHVTTTNGAITQEVGKKITSTTSSTFVAGGDNDITLTNNDNEFGVLSMSGKNVAAKDKNALPLGNIIATGTVGITTTDGAITQSTGSKIEAGGDTTIVAGNNKDITLNNDNNDFNHIAATGKNITIKDKDDIALDNIIATGTVNITTTNGDITQVAGKKITADGDTTITAGNGKDVTLEESDNDFNKITVAGKNVSVKDKDGLEVGGLTATGTAKVVTTTGNITQTTGSTVSVTGTTTLIAGGTGTGDGTVTLGSTTNTFGAPVNITGSDATIGARTAPTFGTLTGLTAPTVQTPPQTNGNNVQQVIDSIIQSAGRPPVISGNNNPSFTSPIGTPAPLIVTNGTTPTFTTGGVSQGGTPLSFVSQPSEGEANQRITLSELRSLQQSSNQEGQSGTTPIAGEIRIALAQNSLIGLINGGVRLPEGVDQEFYVVEDRRAQR